MFQIKRTAGQH